MKIIANETEIEIFPRFSDNSDYISLTDYREYCLLSASLFKIQ